MMQYVKFSSIDWNPFQNYYVFDLTALSSIYFPSSGFGTLLLLTVGSFLLVTIKDERLVFALVSFLLLCHLVDDLDLG